MAQLDLIGSVVRDMAAALQFHRLLGLDIHSHKETEPHMEAVLPGVSRIACESPGAVGRFLEPTLWYVAYPDGNLIDLETGKPNCSIDIHHSPKEN